MVIGWSSLLPVLKCYHWWVRWLWWLNVSQAYLGQVCMRLIQMWGSDVLRPVCVCFQGFLWLRLDSHPFNMLKHQCGHSWRPPRQKTSEAGKRERKIWNQGKVDLVSSVVNLCVNSRKENRLLRGKKIRESMMFIKLIAKHTKIIF